ncbi:unnamed protein product [Sphagnum jensenii]
MQAGDVLVFQFFGQSVRQILVASQNLPNGVLLFTNIARSCLTGGLIQELEEHIGSGQGFQQPQDWTNLETSTGSGLRLHTPGFNEEYWQAGPGACGFVGGHFQDFNVSHFASGEGSSRNDHAETSSEPPSFLERYEIQQTNPGGFIHGLSLQGIKRSQNTLRKLAQTAKEAEKLVGDVMPSGSKLP